MALAAMSALPVLVLLVGMYPKQEIVGMRSLSLKYEYIHPEQEIVRIMWVRQPQILIANCEITVGIGLDMKIKSLSCGETQSTQAL